MNFLQFLQVLNFVLGLFFTAGLVVLVIYAIRATHYAGGILKTLTQFDHVVKDRIEVVVSNLFGKGAK